MTNAGDTGSRSATSADGLVRATVDPTGDLRDLEFAPTAFAHGDPASLARTVLETVRAATARDGRTAGDADAVARAEAPPRPATDGGTTSPPVPPRPAPRRARRVR